MNMNYTKYKVQPALKGCLNLVLREILECYKPIDNELTYWKSFKDSNNVWRKEKVEKTNEDVASIIENRRTFLNQNPLIECCNSEVFFNVKFSKQKLIEMFDEFLTNGCDNQVYARIISAMNDNPLIDD